MCTLRKASKKNKTSQDGSEKKRVKGKRTRAAEEYYTTADSFCVFYVPLWVSRSPTPWYGCPSNDANHPFPFYRSLFFFRIRFRIFWFCISILIIRAMSAGSLHISYCFFFFFLLVSAIEFLLL